MSFHRMVLRAVWPALLSSTVLASVGQAQKKPKPKDSVKVAKDSVKMAKAASDSGKVARFFRSETPLTVTLTTNIKRIRGDKSDTPPWRTATLSYAAIAPDTGTVTIPIRIKTRGIWWLANCDFPPIWLNFNSAVKGTEFRGLDQVKLTSYCHNNDEGERYVLQELQLNRALRLLTPISHAVRAVHVTYVDSASGKKEATRWAFAQEEPLTMAGRLEGKIIKATGANADDLDPFQLAFVGVFEYFIGNTDFSIPALHNIELLGLNNGLTVLPIAHDFDFSGAVNARYATVHPLLQREIHSVRQRLFRGYCVPANYYADVFKLFNAKKDSIYGLYRDPIGKLLPDNTVKETLEYFDEFYKTINNPKSAKDDIIGACNPAGKR
jgi:hypothetical protein